MDFSLFAALAGGPKRAPELQQKLKVSQPTLSRLASRARAAGRLAVLGRGRATRYALLRSIRGLPPELPIHRISHLGRVQRVGTLFTLEPHRLWFENSAGGGGTEFDALPWFLADLRPRGFVGKLLARDWPELGLPLHPEDWSTDQILFAMARRGEDAVGDLLVGDESLARWQSNSAGPAIAPVNRLLRYSERVAELLAGRAGSAWVGGEQPKFTAVVASGPDAQQPVIVKFSGSRAGIAGRRWANLLLAEHLATEVLREHGHLAAVTTFLQNERRSYLEIQRFDRNGLRGRLGMVSLQALDEAFAGEGRGWADSVAALLRAGRISSEDARELRWRAAFSALIGNTDMHQGNVALLSSERGGLRLGPAFDMLPMIYAPLGEELPTREFVRPLPAPACVDQWAAALPVAISFWQRLAEDARASLDMRNIARDNAALLRHV